MKTERFSREYQPPAVCVLTESIYRIWRHHSTPEEEISGGDEMVWKSAWPPKGVYLIYSLRITHSLVYRILLKDSLVYRTLFKD